MPGLLTRFDAPPHHLQRIWQRRRPPRLLLAPVCIRRSLVWPAASAESEIAQISDSSAASFLRALGNSSHQCACETLTCTRGGECTQSQVFSTTAMSLPTPAETPAPAAGAGMLCTTGATRSTDLWSECRQGLLSHKKDEKNLSSLACCFYRTQHDAPIPRTEPIFSAGPS